MNENTQRIRMIVAYDGTDFLGWQKQPDGPTIQSTIEEVLSQVFNKTINTIGSGRTDTGVHAFEQNFHFDIESFKHPDLLYAINRMLPRSIRIQKAMFAPKEFHSQHSAEKKIYRYRILQSKVLCPFRRHFTWWPAKMLNTDVLNSMAEILIGDHDFKSFQSTGTPVSSTVRTIYSAKWTQTGDELVFEVEGNGFLKQMVRNLVGAMVDLHLRSATPTEDFKTLMGALDRRKMGAPAPAQGLSLISVTYSAELEENCSPLPKKISH